MTHLPDLSPCRYFPIDHEDKLVAVGWLDPGSSDWVAKSVAFAFTRTASMVRLLSLSDGFPKTLPKTLSKVAPC